MRTGHVPYPELNAAVEVARAQFSQATRYKAILLTGGRVACEVWHGREAVTFVPEPEQIREAMRP
jgi:hypothetical protein